MKKLNPNELTEGEIVKHKRRYAVFISFNDSNQMVSLVWMTPTGGMGKEQFQVSLNEITSANTKRNK